MQLIQELPLSVDLPKDVAPLNREACRAYLDQTTFRPQPSEYSKSYPLWPGSVGLEIEMLPVVAAPASGQAFPGSVPLQGEGFSSASILRQEAKRHGWTTEETTGDHGQPLLLKLGLEEQDNISFEPGGQVEFSSRPYPCLGEAVRRMNHVQKLLDHAFAERGVSFVQVGIDPWHTVAEIGLQMPKGRYRAMDQHYSAIGEYGQRMMRQTCTLQVNLDFGADEQTMVKRYLASQLFAPVATATFAYSPIVDRKAQGVRSFRSRIWRHTDPTHTGFVGMEHPLIGRGTMTRQAWVDAYLEFALNATVVFVAALDYYVPRGTVTFGEWLTKPIRGVSPTMADFVTHLTLLFPEVRPRGFLEIRSIDCQPRAFQGVPAAYATGLLYDNKTLDRLLDLLLPVRSQLPELIRRAEGGLTDPQLAALAKSVMTLACEGFAALPGCFKATGGERELTVFADTFTQRELTPADAVILQLQATGAPYLPLSAYQALEQRWAALLN